MRSPSIVVAGGGASGTLLAIRLLARSPEARVTIVEPRERLGAGVAYSTQSPVHFLNVPAAGMTAFPEDREHFLRWLHENGYEHYDARSFVPRRVYGAYLTDLARRAQSEAGPRLRHVRALATGVEVDGSGVRVACSNGEAVSGGALVVALGNAAPAAWPRIAGEALASNRFFGSAWDPQALVPGDPNETVLLLGTGLTAADAVLGLRANGHTGKIYMVSRRGLLPHEHRLFDAPPAACPQAETVRDLVASVRASVREARTASGNWRTAIDGVRPKTNALWQALTLADQRRFMRHVMPYWNVHRHRMAPEAAKALAELIAADDLRTLAGRTGEIVARGAALRVPVQLRGENETLVVEAARVINCSGPEHDFRKLPNPLIRDMLDRGLMTPYPLNIGIVVEADGALVGAGGAPSDRLFAIGPVRCGTLIETTAIPEIRVQAAELAERLSGEAVAADTAG